MAESLKSKNTGRLLAVICANVVTYYAILQREALQSQDWAELLRDPKRVLPAALGLVLTSGLNSLLPPAAKDRLVFLKWDNPLPGSEAFSRHAMHDPRVDRSRLEKAYGTLPVEPSDQNRLWYRMYKLCADEPAVMQSHREFLFFRDYASLAVLAMVVIGSIAVLQIAQTGPVIACLSIVMLQYLLAAQAARNNGIRLVTTVLATISAKD